jgi:hypothetical protein
MTTNIVGRFLNKTLIHYLCFIQVAIKSPHIISITFSLNKTADDLGKSKAVLCLMNIVPQVWKTQQRFRENLRDGANYDSGQVGNTSISICEVCPKAKR